MDLQSFFTSPFPLSRLPVAFLNVVCEMALYLLLGFLIAGVLHVFVPQKFYANYLSRKNRLSVLWAALLGILAIAVPMYICSTGSIPVAAALMMKGLSPGAALVMLMAGLHIFFLNHSCILPS